MQDRDFNHPGVVDGVIVTGAEEAAKTVIGPDGQPTQVAPEIFPDVGDNRRLAQKAGASIMDTFASVLLRRLKSK